MSFEREAWNGCRYDASRPGGHYESWFQRGNHPTRPLAFWIRYTIFAPEGLREEAEGELWAVYFDGTGGGVTAVKESFPLARCRFGRSTLDVQIAEATLDAERLEGEASGGEALIAWELRYRSPERHLLTLDRSLYGTPFPKAKALVGSPNAVFDGHLTVDGEVIPIDGWVGSQNHNWGARHTDRYAWGQVAGFDDAPDTFLEVATARLRLGRFWSPAMTVITLRLGEEELRLNGLRQSLRASGRYDYFHWSFASATPEVRVTGSLAASAEHFVGLPYRNPPGGTKTCLNSKLARCDLTIRRHGAAPRTLTCRDRAAFEILTDDDDHGVPVLELDAGRGGCHR